MLWQNNFVANKNIKKGIPVNAFFNVAREAANMLGKPLAHKILISNFERDYGSVDLNKKNC
jgi:hypothetical protein